MLTKSCLKCEQTIKKPQNESLKNWHTRHKFCSKDCADKYWIGKRRSLHGFVKGHTPWLKGTKGLVKPNSGSFKKGHVGPYHGKRFPHVTGPLNNHWKGGVTSLRQRIRKLPEYKIWRYKIFERDNWTCECGQRGGFLHAHHSPKYFSTIIEENQIDTLEKAINCKALWEAEGRTLCLVCHKLAHKKIIKPV